MKRVHGKHGKHERRDMLPPTHFFPSNFYFFRVFPCLPWTLFLGAPGLGLECMDGFARAGRIATADTSSAIAGAKSATAGGSSVMAGGLSAEADVVSVMAGVSSAVAGQ
uniref:Uncharacterized protein n=1 Tax=Candidatus Kentrum sp. LFY TaxID=2126342 RepID=A0A450V6H0_9GAMM|nr:MAG: hypothetical protein BECKLFY1418B_GA0070995_11841 [Candidatus Kentron sp. LFY]